MTRRRTALVAVLFATLAAALAPAGAAPAFAAGGNQAARDIAAKIVRAP